jgi:hypothetical protein
MSRKARLITAYYYKLKAEQSGELAPALRKDIWPIVGEFAAYRKRWGVYAATRYMAKRGFPIELALAAIYY